MASPEDVLRASAAAILRTRPCLDIAFVFAGISFMGYHYGYVADLIQQDRIHVKVGNTGGFTATYDYRWDKITFSSADPAQLAAPDARATLVHEATHAVVDLTHKGRSVDYGNNEVAAYIAETLYRLNADISFDKYTPVGGRLYTIATAIKNKKQDGPYEVDPSDRLVVDLRGAHSISLPGEGRSPGNVCTRL